MENVSKNACDCGDTRVVYYPDENQHEPACWECYENQPTWVIEPRQHYCVYIVPATPDEELDELPF